MGMTLICRKDPPGTPLQATVCTQVYSGAVWKIVAFPIRHPPWVEHTRLLKGRPPSPWIWVEVIVASGPAVGARNGHAPWPAG